MKLPNTKDLEGVKMFFRRKWYELSRSNARFFAFGLATGTLFTLSSLWFVGNFGVIHGVLSVIDSGGRIQYFTSIGGAVLGVLAITFSLAVFALQHAAEHGSVRILESFGNSRRVLLDYILIGSVSFLVYVLGLTPQQNSYFASVSLLLSLALIIVVLWRVFAFYKFIVKFINPIEQIHDLSREVKKILLKARELLLQIRTIEEIPAPPKDGPTAGIDAEDLFVTANFDHDNIFLPYNSHVISLVDRMRVYAGKERHEVTLQGYRELIDIASTYFSARKYSTANAGMFVQDARTDKYLMLLLEQLKSLFSQVIKMEDQEGLQQNFYCHIGIAAKVANYKILGRDVANPNLNFVIGYLHRNLLEALRKNVDDAVLNGVRYLQTIISHIPSNHYLTMSQLGDHFKEEAVMSIAVQKWYITQETVNGMVGIVAWSLSDSFRTSLILKSILKHLSEVARYYVAGGLSVDINGGGLSSAISVVNQNSIPYILNEYLVRTWEKDGTFDEDVFEEFCDYYDSLGKIAAESGSFLMHFVLGALNIHIEQLVRLRWHKDQKNSDQFLEGIKKTLQTYRSIYSYLPEGYEDRKFGYLEFERVKETALWAAKKKDEGIFTAVVETFVSFYKQARKKTRDEFTALRLYVDLVELGAIASGSGMDEVANKLVNMATEVQKEQMEIHGRGEIPAKYREELEERLSHEIWRLYDDYRQYNPMRHDDIKLESFISREDFMKFLNRIELLVYNREITERRSSMF